MLIFILMLNIYRMLFLVMKRIQIVKIPPPLVPTARKKKIPSSKISSSFLSDEMSNCVWYGCGQMTRFVQKKSPINALL